MSAAKEKHVVQLSQVQPESIEWLWPGRIALGKLSLIDGDPGQGKSLMTLDLAARVTVGREFPDGTTARRGSPDPAEKPDRRSPEARETFGPPGGRGQETRAQQGPPGGRGQETRAQQETCAQQESRVQQGAGVVLVGCEDGVSDTIVGRLQAAHADLSQVHTFDGTSGAGQGKGLPSFPEDCPLLEEVVRESKARLVIIDPLLAFISSNVWSVNDQMVRRALAPLARVAEQTRAAMILVRHLSKWGGGQRAIYRGSGSIGIIGSARTAFLVGRDPEEPDVRVLASTKNNLGAPLPSLGFRIVADGHGRGHIEWTGSVDVTAEEMVQVPSHRHGEQLPRAVDYLEKLLGKGPCPRDWVLRKTRAHGISNRTLLRAKSHLEVVSKETHENGRNVWYWSLTDAKPSPDDGEEYPADGRAVPATEEQRRMLDLALKN